MSDGKKKVLLASIGDMDRGGVQVFLSNWIKQSRDLDLEYTWYFAGRYLDEGFAQQFRQQGVELIAGDHEEASGLAEKLRSYRSIIKELNDIMEAGDFDVVHVNTGTMPLNVIGVICGKRKGIRVRIAHSHSADDNIGRLKTLFYQLCRELIAGSATCLAACSEKAAVCLFGEKYAPRARIINNCIEAERFGFSPESRGECRKRHGLDGCFVMGQVARLSEVKNQRFLIDVFRCVQEKVENARLLLVGSGPMESELRTYAAQLGLADKVVFAGSTDRTQDYYCAMDLFLLPSLYEGLGIVAVEAQASGLPCILSDMVPDGAKLTDLVTFMPLAAGAQGWAEKVLQMKEEGCRRERAGMWQQIRRVGYDVSNLRDAILRLYE